MPQAVNDISTKLAGHTSVTWKELPDLELYMDQVVTYAQKQLQLFQDAQSEKLVTPAILSNGVKSGLIQRPTKKKYGKKHLATLIMACTLKQVFPVQQVEQLLELGFGKEEELFETFGRLQDESLSSVAQTLNIEEEDKQQLCEKILQLCLTANANRLAARMLLQQLIDDKPNEKTHKE